MPDPSPSSDAYSPAEIAQRVRDLGVVKSQLDGTTTFLLAVLAGAFIALGACFSMLASTSSELGVGVTRVFAGFTFSLGLILVVVAGAELFTGNNLIVMAWASGLVTTRRLLRNWAIVWIGNLVGALGTAVLVTLADPFAHVAPDVRVTAVRIAEMKCALAVPQAFFLGVLCNALVCLAVWLCFSARTTTDKILSIVFPITAFVALGFEHSVANMFVIPFGWMQSVSAEITLLGCLQNLVVVTLGNVVGGSGLVAGIYWLVYLRPSRRDAVRW